MKNFVTWLIALTTLIFAMGVQAHQQKSAITTVLFNPRTDNLEIMHRFNLHDAEHAVKAIFGKQADILSNGETQQQFADYVAERFAVKDTNLKLLPLKRVGHEIDGKHFWVYQETPRPEGAQSLAIQHDALRDLWPTQTNTVNVEGKGDVRTLTFDGNVTLLKVTFDSSH